MKVIQSRHIDALPIGEPDDGAENRRRVLGVGQPILIEIAMPPLGQAMQEILVLVGVVQGRLRVDDAE